MTGGHDDIVTLDKLTPISLHVPSEKQISRSKACLCVWWPAVWFCQYCIFTICKLLKQWRHSCPDIYRILLGGTLQCKVLVNETAWRISSFSFVCQNSSKRIISLRVTRIVQYPWNKNNLFIQHWGRLSEWRSHANPNNLLHISNKRLGPNLMRLVFLQCNCR